MASIGRPLARWVEAGRSSCDVPDTMLPADDIWVKFTARAAAGEQQPPALQVHGYHYEATVDGPPLDTRRCHSFRLGAEDGSATAGVRRRPG